ncbi:hypothetical protein O181_067021 [Austropuccinia psidii MF-1]|uniref:Uncharacterized protein n=1 Tax=Austropuccinia psidii MF-1 TaxID=1389203 RepID=A0A9Q3I2P6_9BASI|nr:hypothetical protein [Austropuccinia psidii MF-1]
MGQLTQTVSARNTPRGPVFKTPSMKAPDSFDDTRYNERQKERGIHQEKKPPISGSNFPSLLKVHHQKGLITGRRVSQDMPHPALLTKDNKLIYSKKESMIKEGLCAYCGGKHPIENASKGLKIDKGSKENSLASREKPEWGS